MIRSKLKFSNLVALLALFVALGGTGYAAFAVPKNSVGAAQIKANAITASKVKNGSLQSADFKTGQLPKGATGATGPAGPVGVAGPAGAAGAAGAPGTALAYAHVNADGTLDAANSKGVTGSLIGTDPGRYCFNLSFTPKNIITSAERVVGGINGAFAEPAITTTITAVCPAGSQSAGVLMFNGAGTLVNNAFFIMFN